jgi:hypothetical protein
MTGSTPGYDIEITQDVAVITRDGVRLATDMYVPARDGEVAPGRFPAIVQRTSYDKSREPFAKVARYFCRRGYAAVV